MTKIDLETAHMDCNQQQDTFRKQYLSASQPEKKSLQLIWLIGISYREPNLFVGKHNISSRLAIEHFPPKNKIQMV